MAGGILKTIGILGIVLGILLLVAGAAGAGFALYAKQQNQDKGLFADPQADRDSQALLAAGGIGAGAGLLLLILGIVLNAIGNGRRHRALLRAVVTQERERAPPAALAPATPDALPDPTPPVAVAAPKPAPRKRKAAAKP